MTVSETKLLPCPFCGGADVNLHRPQQALGSWVSCRSCGLESPTETGVTKDEATKYWNTRALTAALSDQADGWQDISTAPKDGSFIWLSDGFFMRIGYWYVVTKDPSQEHWADMLRAERGGLGDLQWEPKYWQPTPTAPILSGDERNG